MALEYDMNRRGSLSLYEYLYRCLRDDIVAGVIAADDRLPSKRKLADRLGVSLITVESAYAQLIAEGYVVARERRGYYVAQLGRASLTPKEIAQTKAIHGQGGGLRDLRGLRQPPAQKIIADFSRPSTPMHSPAATLWSRALRDVLAHEAQDDLFGLQPAQGSSRLQEAIACYLQESRNMTVDPERIVIGAGAQVLYVLIAQLLGVGRAMAIENPGYPKLAQIYRHCGLHVQFISLDDEGISMQELRKSKADIVHIMPSHQFPTGRVTSIARRYELLGWAAQEPGRYIIEDDYDREFRLAGMPIPTLCSIDTQGSVIYVNTFSKSLSSALRMAYMVLPQRLAKQFEKELGFYTNTVSMVDQVALARLIESGEYERHVSRYRKRQRDIRDKLIEAIKVSRLGTVAQIEEADSGLHFVLALDVAPTEREIAQRTREEGVILAPLEDYLCDLANVKDIDDMGKDDGLRRFVMQYEGLNVDLLPQIISALERAAGL